MFLYDDTYHFASRSLTCQHIFSFVTDATTEGSESATTTVTTSALWSMMMDDVVVVKVEYYVIIQRQWWGVKIELLLLFLPTLSYTGYCLFTYYHTNHLYHEQIMIEKKKMELEYEEMNFFF